MAFKSFTKYMEDKNGDFFVLPNDNDSATVIFLYRSAEDVLVGDVHYITSASYKGYAHCCGEGCPACNYPTQSGRGIKLDHLIFIPLYNVAKRKIEFWQRSTFFEQVLQRDVFTPFPNPSEVIFRITRHGEANSRDTRYAIEPIARNSIATYDKLLADAGITFPDGYSMICKDMSIAEMSAALNNTKSVSDLQDYGYVPVPRGGASTLPEYTPTPSVSVDIPEYSAPPEVEPPSSLASSLPDYDPQVMNVPQAESGNDGDDITDSLDDVNF